MPLPKEYLDTKLDKLPKKVVKKIVRQVHNVFNDPDWTFEYKKLKNKCGVMDPGTWTITLDFRRDLVPSIIHECLHVRYPTLTEKQVSKIEQMIANSLSLRQVRGILIKIIDTMR